MKSEEQFQFPVAASRQSAANLEFPAKVGGALPRRRYAVNSDFLRI
jgi:hypothetical protein